MAGQTLGELRLKRNLSQKQMAERVGVMERTIRRWELGEVSIPSCRLATVARTLRVDYNTLMKAIGEMQAVDAREIAEWHPPPPQLTDTKS